MLKTISSKNSFIQAKIYSLRIF